MTKPYTVEGLKRESRDFVYSLDRSVLGSFAVDSGLLVIADSIQRIDMLHDDVEANNLPADLDELDRILGEKMFRSKGFKGFGLLPEVCHWWISDGTSAMSRHANALLKRSPEMVSTRAHRLTLAATYPAMHSFFEADIWDVPFIERCIADGVDIDLALSMSEVGAR